MMRMWDDMYSFAKEEPDKDTMKCYLFKFAIVEVKDAHNKIRFSLEKFVKWDTTNEHKVASW